MEHRRFKSTVAPKKPGGSRNRGSCIRRGKSPLNGRTTTYSRIQKTSHLVNSSIAARRKLREMTSIESYLITESDTEIFSKVLPGCGLTVKAFLENCVFRAIQFLSLTPINFIQRSSTTACKY